MRNASCPRADKKRADDEATDEFTRLKKLSSKQIGEIRRTITERDELISSSSGSGGHASVQLSARIRELLREVQDTHGLMQKCVAKEEKKLAKGKRDLPYTQEDLEAHREITELVGKHIVECQVPAAHSLLPVCCRCTSPLRRSRATVPAPRTHPSCSK